jgi:TrmH family RNA methyltransferase
LLLQTCEGPLAADTMNLMLTAAERAHLTVVLVGARNPSNIGAAARAMQDFGFRDLRIVNDYAAPFEAAQLEDSQQNVKSAVGAASVMAEARRYSSLAEAIADCTLIVGTTAIGERDMRREVVPLQQAAPSMLAQLRALTSADHQQQVALLFGSEKTGLSNEELSHCNALMTIPMHPSEGERHVSMNLGQAAAVSLFELVRNDVTTPAPTAQQPSAGDLERLTTLLQEVLEVSGYSKRHPANCDPAQVRRLVRRMSLEPQDAPVWMGILRQLLWKMDDNK